MHHITHIFMVFCANTYPVGLDMQHLYFNNIHRSQGHAVICFTVLCTLHVRSLPLHWVNFKYSINYSCHWRHQQPLSRPYKCSATLPDKTQSHICSHTSCTRIKWFQHCCRRLHTQIYLCIMLVLHPYIATWRLVWYKCYWCAFINSSILLNICFLFQR